MKKYSIRINLPFECDLEEATKNTVLRSNRFRFTSFGHFTFDKNRLPTKLIEWLNNKGLEIFHTEVFYSPSNSNLSIHADLADIGTEVIKLNWQYGAQGSRMIWYNVKPNQPQVIGRTIIDTPYLHYTRSQVTVAESEKIGTPTLVTASVPHSVINNTGESRFVLCAVVCNKNRDLTWEKARELFREDAA